jgi:hypothetical protein
MKSFRAIVLSAGVVLLSALNASASSITYDLTPLTIGSLSLTGGTITTDGTIGTLASSDIIGWSVTITGGSPSPDTISGSSPYNSFSGSSSALTATPSELLFNFTEFVIPSLFLSEDGNSGVSYNAGPLRALPGSIYLDVGSSEESMEETSSAFVIASVAPTPLPATLQLFTSVLGIMGLIGRWRGRGLAV